MIRAAHPRRGPVSQGPGRILKRKALVGDGWFKSILKPLGGTFRELIAVSLFINILALASPIFVLQVYDRVVFYSGISTLEALLIGMLIALLFDYLLRQFRSKLVQRLALRIDVQISQALFDKLLSLPLRHLEGKPAAYWQALFRDVETVRNTLSGPSAMLAADLPFAVLFLGVVFVLAQPVAWLLILAVVTFLILTWRSGTVLDRLNLQERQTGYTRDAVIQEFVNGRTTIKALALDNSLKPRWEESQAKTIERALERGHKTDKYANLGTLMTVSTTVLLTTVGALAILSQNLTMGALIAANMLSARIMGPFNQLFTTWKSYAQTRQAFKRLDEVFSIADERKTSSFKLDRPAGKLALENVTYRYGDSGPPVVEGVRLTFEPGGIAVIVGKNGSGKTTLLKLILGLYKPTIGRILLDHADIGQFARIDLTEWVGYVPQECILFTGTIRDNIVKGVETADDDMVVRAATLAGLHQSVIDLPDGYSTEIGEAGMRMSGGMRQRIGIARALLRDPPVILLDEPSSNLDRQAEEELRNGLVALSKDHTVIIATHSSLLLGVAKTVVALDRGRVAVAGPANEVLPRLQGRPPAAAQPAAQQPAAHQPTLAVVEKPAPQPAVMGRNA